MGIENTYTWKMKDEVRLLPTGGREFRWVASSHISWREPEQRHQRFQARYEDQCVHFCFRPFSSLWMRKMCGLLHFRRNPETNAAPTTWIINASSPCRVVLQHRHNMSVRNVPWKSHSTWWEFKKWNLCLGGDLPAHGAMENSKFMASKAPSSAVAPRCRYRQCFYE